MAHRGMKFGIFLAPFHRVGENPTLAMNRDVELLEWLDWLGYVTVFHGPAGEPSVLQITERGMSQAGARP